MKKAATVPAISFFRRITLLFLILLSVLQADAQKTAEYEIETVESIIGTGEVTIETKEDLIVTGEDETRIVSRFDVRYIYQERASDNEHRITLRLDESFDLSDEWTLGTRVDLPLRYNDRFNAVDNPNSDWEAGIGDVLLQGLITRRHLTSFPWRKGIRNALHLPWSTETWTVVPRFRWSAGMRTILPTATGDQFGSGKWQLGMLAALTYDIPEISQGSYVGLTVRNQFDIAGDSDRNDINQLVLTPRMRLNIGSRWAFITAPNIRINLENDNELFVPISGQLSYRDNATVYSLEVQHAIVDDFAIFDTQIEFRIGFFY